MMTKWRWMVLLLAIPSASALHVPDELGEYEAVYLKETPGSIGVIHVHRFSATTLDTANFWVPANASGAQVTLDTSRFDTAS